MTKLSGGVRRTGPWVADRGDGLYRNPVLYADYSDPDVIRVGADFYLVASSFNCVPGIPILHSNDLVNWTILNHVVERLPAPAYDRPALGCGVWAPSLRYHAGRFWVFFGMPDEGLYVSTAAHPADRWSPPERIKAAQGWIDPCPFWDEDGQAYLVHALARSRAGANSVLRLCRLKPDGTALLDDGQIIFDGAASQPTIEGPKMYRRNGYYYIFAPAGGVAHGWQTVLRARNLYGPYEERVVMAQGQSEINGPHQGAWVSLASGEDWFVHMQDRGPYGRVVHLQPVHWIDDWPIIGQDRDGTGVGTPVAGWTKPEVGACYPAKVPQTGDGFSGACLGRQWQWPANPQPEWMSLTAHPGHLRMYAVPMPEPADLRTVPNLLLQKFPAPAFSATTCLSMSSEKDGVQAGLVVMGRSYAYAGLQSHATGCRLVQSRWDADRELTIVQGCEWPCRSIYLRLTVTDGALCRFSTSADGRVFEPLGDEFPASAGIWIGAKVGLYCNCSRPAASTSWADFAGFCVDGLPSRTAVMEHAVQAGPIQVARLEIY